LEFLTEDDYVQAAKIGLTYQHVYSRFYRYGWSKEDAISKPISKPNLWKQYQELAKQHNIEQGTFYSRVYQLGLSPEEAATKPLNIKQSRNGEGNGLRKYKKIAESNGVSRNTFYKRIHKLGWTPEKASTEPIRRLTR
jgi:uncharacterized protein YjcR